LSVQQSSFSVGTDIPVEITLTNISNEVLEVTYSGVPAVDFMPIVLRSNGSSAAPLEPLMKAVNPEVINGGATTDRLEPKEMVNERMIVNQLFDMKEPGRYVVQVSRRVADGSAVKSNKLIVFVGR
jgi:hypothetical protein